MSNLIGVVLCGGKSTRMGTDKGLIVSENKPWALQMTQKLETEGLQTFISINTTQQDSYRKHFAKEQLIVDSTDIPGPIDGLMSVHNLFPKNDILLLGCDMIAMQQQTIEDLIATKNQNPAYDFFAYHNKQFWEPLCAIYTAKGLEKLKANLYFTKDHSFQHLLNEGHSLKIAVTSSASFKNVNSKEN